MIELDVQLTRDAQLVVIHDRALDRTTAATGAVRDRTLAELQQLDTGGWFDAAFRGERMLTLTEVFALLAGRAALNVEIKSPEPDWPGTAEALAAVLTGDRLSTTIVSSFDMGALAAVRARLPQVAIGVLWHHLDLDPAWEWAGRLGASAFHPYSPLVTDEVVRAAHARSLRVNTWTVNDEADIARLAAVGVDGIISDFPDRVQQVRRHLRAGRAPA
jgi:glycerophosphoryl diester phosphodiesterase